MALDLKTVVQGIKFLIASEGTRQHEQNSSFAETLELLLSKFESFLSEREALSVALAAGQKQFHISLGPNETLYWRFTAKSLCLLCALVDLLQEVQTPGTSTLPSPPAPKHMLGVTDQKLIQCLLQRVVYVGIYPYLLPGVDSLVKLRLGHLRGAAKAAAPVEQCAWHLFKCSQMLLHCAEDQTLGPLLLAHHLSDLLVALIQVCYGRPGGGSAATPGPHRGSLTEQASPSSPGAVHLCQVSAMPGDGGSVAIAESDRAWCEKALDGLLDRVHQPVVVRELLCLQSGGAPKARSGGTRGGEEGRESAKNLRWLQRACGRLLSERLMKKNGVQSVLRGILDAMAGSGDAVGTEGRGGGGSAEDSAQDWRKCRAIAQVMAHSPYQASSPEHYYSLVCPQVLELLHLSSDEIRQQVLRVTVAILDAMVSQNKPLADRFLIGPLLQPLEALCTAEGAPGSVQEGLAERLQACMDDLCKICGVMEVTSPLVPVFTRYLPVIFEISRVCGEQDQISTQHPGCQARSPATAVLCFLLLATDTAIALQHLMSLFGASVQGTVDLKWVNPIWTLTPGPSPAQPLRVSSSPSNEGGLQEVDRMEGRASHLVGLLRSDLKQSRLTGKLCLMCLSYIEGVLHKAVYKPSVRGGPGGNGSSGSGPGGSSVPSIGRTSSVLLDLEGGDPSTDHLPVLFLVASLCEHMTVEVIEQVDLRQMLEVLLLVVTVYADFVGTDSSGSQGLLVVQPDLDTLPGSVIPLSIAIGLLSSVAGGAQKVGRNDRPLLKQFLCPLEVISSRFPDPDLQTQAGELRICLATMGAVWSSELDKLNTNLTGKAKDTTATTGREGTRSKLIEVLQSTPTSPSPSGIAGRLKKGTEKNAPAGVEEHPAGVEEHPAGVEEHPAGVEEHPAGVEEHPAGVEEHPAGVEEHPAGVRGEHSQHSGFQAALVDLGDVLLPVKAHGILALAKLVEARDSEALACTQSLIVIFKENLRHTDSYVYLAAIDGLVALASTLPKDVIPLLCQEYVCLSSSRESSGQKKEGLSEKVQHVLKMGEALVRVARALGDLLPHYSEALLASIMVNVRSTDAAVRTSALSNMADVCSLLHWSFGRVQNEVLGCIAHVLQTDKDPSARQAALMVLKLLIRGLSQDTIQVLGGSLRDVYRLLKRVEAAETDPLTQVHAQAVMGELDTVMKAYLFPQETLTKKISVLDPV